MKTLNLFKTAAMAVLCLAVAQPVLAEDTGGAEPKASVYGAVMAIQYVPARVMSCSQNITAMQGWIYQAQGLGHPCRQGSASALNFSKSCQEGLTDWGPI